MKRSFILLLVAVSLIVSCKKDSNTRDREETVPTVLLTKIINNIPGDPDFGNTIATFTYNGKQLATAKLYRYGFAPDVETDVFNYDDKGKLTGTTISHTSANDNHYVKAAIQYSGNDINRIIFYKAGEVIGEDIPVTYTDGKLSRYVLRYNDNSYTYNDKGNNIKEVSKEMINGIPNGYVYTRNSTSFDDKNNLSSALPYWVYFRVYNENQCYTRFPGKNNPLSSDEHGTFTYEYNSNNYPTTISFNLGNKSYKYEYTEVK